MANYEATRYDFDGSNLIDLTLVNTGVILPWGTAAVPTGFLECNGQAVSQSTYADLYAIIGTTYGDPGGGNFNLPDLTDRVVIGKSNNKSLASTGGANDVAGSGCISGSTGCHTLTTCEIPSHQHNAGASSGNSTFCNSGSTVTGGNTGSTGGGTAHSHTLSANFVGSANSVLQPYLTLIHIIKY